MVTICIILLIAIAITQVYIIYRPSFAIIDDNNLHVKRFIMWYDKKTPSGLKRDYKVLIEFNN